MTAKPGQYLTFELCGHMYAISIDKIASILNEWGAIAPVPEFPDYGRGAINHWGYVIPVIDPRIRMNIPGAQTAQTNCLIIVNTGDGAESGVKKDENDDGAGMLGLMADNISTIMNFEESGLCEPPRLTAHTSGYIIGVYKAPSAIIMILEPNLLMTEDMSRAMEEFRESHS